MKGARLLSRSITALASVIVSEDLRSELDHCVLHYVSSDWNIVHIDWDDRLGGVALLLYRACISRGKIERPILSYWSWLILKFRHIFCSSC